MEQIISANGVRTDHNELAEEFLGFSRAARGSAVKSHTQDDPFGEQLATCRANVYEQAAQLVRAKELTEAVEIMIERARVGNIRTPPLIDFDEAAKQHIEALAWQFCARTIDPSLAEVATPWE